MDIVECPHCYCRVAIGDDGSCPSCRRDTRDTTDADLARTQMKVSAFAELPNICFNCGMPSDSTVRVRRTQKTEFDEPTKSKLAVLALFSWIFLIPLMLLKPKRAVEISLPICTTCSAASVTPSPTRTDFDNNTMLMVVHREFKRQATDA